MRTNKGKIFLAAVSLFFLVQCQAKTPRKRRFVPEFKEPGNLSYKDCGSENPAAESIDEQFPWLVRVLVEGRIKPTNCFGVVISNDTVLTSAFCIESDHDGQQRTQKVALVKHMTSKDRHTVVRKIVHDEFNIVEMKNNIAVLKFDQDLLSDGARPICLWNQNVRNNAVGVNQNNGVGTLIGMDRGSTNFKLAKTEVKTDAPEECKKLTFSRFHHFLDHGDMCAKYIGSNKNTCIGGFGAPLQFKIGGKWFLRGLSNSGLKAKDPTLPCYKNHVISFADTARYVNFIAHNAGIGLTRAPSPFEVAFHGQFSYSGCGRNFSSTGNSLAFNAQLVHITEVPWQAALYTFKAKILDFSCGGALISTRFVLTAAHCVYENRVKIRPTNELIIFLGKTSFAGDLTNDGGVNAKAVERIIPNEGYVPTSGSNQHDIALIKLVSPVEFSHTISPVCLWSGSAEETFIAGKNAVMSGWGLINYQGEHAKGLQKLALPILSKDQCRSIEVDHVKNYFARRVEWNVFCAGYVKNETAPCNGDSGSPLVLKRGDKYFLRGLVSESVSHPEDPNFCNPDYPAIFTDVALYRVWIKRITGNELLNYDTTSTPDF